MVLLQDMVADPNHSYESICTAGHISQPSSKVDLQTICARTTCDHIGSCFISVVLASQCNRHICGNRLPTAMRLPTAANDM